MYVEFALPVCARTADVRLSCFLPLLVDALSDYSAT